MEPEGVYQDRVSSRYKIKFIYFGDLARKTLEVFVPSWTKTKFILGLKRPCDA
jgi:hypothetical protein